MSTTEIDPIKVSPVAVPSRVSQATAIEQSRAVAEVQAMVVVAQQVPREMARSTAQMRESCRQPGLAERSFFRYPRGGSTISGPSVHLARELARCFGNVAYGVSELRRDDEYGQSEMQAWAWDVETNARASSTFIVPHKRDTKKGVVVLTDARDIYENNANAAARRLREAIFSILPAWFIEEAKELCARTLEDGGDRPLARRIADAIAQFEGLGVTVSQIEVKLGRGTADWTAHDIAQLGVVYKSIQRGEVLITDEFEAERVTAVEITGESAEKPKGRTRKAAEPIPETPAEPAFTEADETPDESLFVATNGDTYAEGGSD